MSRYTGSIYHKSRSLGFSLLENNKEFSKGKKRTYGPGQHGPTKKTKLSGYGEQLAEKQKLQFMYGMNDRQFRRLFKIAKAMKGSNSLNLLIVLESRIDNLVYRLGFAPTRKGARQLVNHGHVTINGNKCDIPSYIVPVGSEIAIRERALNIPIVRDNKQDHTLKFVEVTNIEKKIGKYTRFPERDELNQEIKETYVVEWYNRLV